MPDDAEIIRRFLSERSEGAFAELVQRHLNLVYFSALRFVNGDAHRAEDVTQCVFTKLATKAPSLGGRSSLAGWLYTTTRFEAGHAVRAERRRQARELEAQRMQDILAETDLPIDWNRLRPVIDDVLCELREPERELVLLRFFQGTPFAEIGARLGLSPDASRFKLDRIIDKMRAALAKRGIRSTSAALALALASQAEASAPAGLVAAVTHSAVTSAGTAGVSLAKCLQIMSTSKLMIGAALIASFLSIGFSVREHTVAHEAEAKLATRTRECDFTSAQLAELTNRAQRAQLDLAILREAAAGGNARSQPKAMAVGAGASPAPSPLPVIMAPAPINRELSNNPDVRAALTAWINSCDNVIYGSFFKALGLSAGQIAAFENLMLQNNINMGTAVLTLRPDGVSPGDVQQSMRSLLGDAGYQQFHEYNKTVYVGEVAIGLAGNLYDSTTPLTPQQGAQLTQIIGQNSTLPPNSGPPFPGTVNWAAVLPQAQAILSAPQFAVFQNEVTVISSQPGLWGAMNPLTPGSIGNTPTPPAAFYAQQSAHQ
jgi:RNA polymerase sigma factor (sigma-70 family)